jgi:hypothetical protein
MVYNDGKLWYTMMGKYNYDVEKYGMLFQEE